MKNISKLVIMLLLVSLVLSACRIGDIENTQTPVNSNSIPPNVIETSNPPDPRIKFWAAPYVSTESIDELMECIETIMSGVSGKYGLSYLNLDNGEKIDIRSEEKYVAAESIAIPVNLYLHSLADSGLIDLQTKVEFTESDKSGNIGEVTESQFGTSFSLADLSEQSMRYYDISAMNMIIRHLGKNEVQEYIESLGALETFVPLYSSPSDMVFFYKEIYKLKNADGEPYPALVLYLHEREEAKLLMNLLPRKGAYQPACYQGRNYGMNALNDSGIFYEEKDYIISVFTEEANTNEAAEIIATVSKAVFGFVNYNILPVFDRDANVMIANNIVESARPDNNFYRDEILIDSNIVWNYFDNDKILFPDSGNYAGDLGLVAFRGNNYRDGGAYGTVDIQEEKLEIIWDFDIGSISTQSGGYWPGVGWTGQPAIVNWDDEIQKTMNIRDKFKNTDFREVIYASLDGNIYFCDLETGEWTRDPIHIGYPTKGSVSIDPRGYPLLFTGQGIGENGTETLVPAFRIFDLTDQSFLYEIGGDDPDSLRDWPNFDSSGLLDAENDTFYEAGENGLIYKIKLNTEYDSSTGDISINPELVKYRYLNPFGIRMGIESSPAIYKNLMYCTDNNGMLMCIDLNTFRAIWIAETGDDTDSTPVLEETEDGVFLYTGNEVDVSGEMDNGTNEEYEATISKFNALTGELLWTRKYYCHYDPIINGGILGTPVLGRNDIDDLVIFSVAKYGGKYNGKLVALNKDTGEEVWAIDSESYSWSSPTAVYTPEGKAYILFCNFAGNMYLIEGATGRILDIVSLGANIEGTPGVYNDMAVIGSYAKKIFGVRIK